MDGHRHSRNGGENNRQNANNNNETQKPAFPLKPAEMNCLKGTGKQVIWERRVRVGGNLGVAKGSWALEAMRKGLVENQREGKLGQK